MSGPHRCAHGKAGLGQRRFDASPGAPVSPAVSDMEPGASGAGSRGSAVAGEQKPPGALCSLERARRRGGTRRAGCGGDARRGGIGAGSRGAAGETAGPAPCCPGAAPRPGPRAGAEGEGVAGLVPPG